MGSKPHRWGNTALQALAVNFVAQEHVGIFGELIIRAARYFGGDPAFPVNVSSPNAATPAFLPDATTAQTAVLHVQGRGIVYTVDGTLPVFATSPQVQVGSVITLEGLPTIRAFQFVSQTGAAAQLTGFYYD